MSKAEKSRSSKAKRTQKPIAAVTSRNHKIIDAQHLTLDLLGIDNQGNMPEDAVRRAALKRTLAATYEVLKPIVERYEPKLPQPKLSWNTDKVQPVEGRCGPSARANTRAVTLLIQDLDTYRSFQ